MKDRDTQYRLAQNAAMSCAFDTWIPGGANDQWNGRESFKGYINRMIDNARNSGAYIEKHIPHVFGKTEIPFFLTEAQLGKVRGDTFETIARAVLWNCCSDYSRRNPAAPVGVLSLGDNYDLRRLFTPASGRRLIDFTDTLATRGLNLSYSTPDLIFVDLTGLGCITKKYFESPILDLSLTSQARMTSARSALEYNIEPNKVVLACGLKTSIRSDRMFQFLFEANAWKYIWRRVLGVTPCPYHSLTSQTFGADPARLNSIDFSSIGDASDASKAIDVVTTIDSPQCLKQWFGKWVVPILDGQSPGT
jgi:hypothetical protein